MIIERHVLENFLPFRNLKKIFDALNQVGEARLVGGCVREIAQRRMPKDIDIACTCKPEITVAALEKVGIKCIPTGIKYGTITALIGTDKFEITTLRTDLKTFGRQAEVDFTHDFEEDSKRRDFTFNALYLDLDGNIYDYTDGIKDLESKTLRFIGNADERIKEDYLRILRYFRFYAYFGGDAINSEALAACSRNRAGIAQLSGERIRAELAKMLEAPFAAESIRLMAKTQVLDEIVPKIPVNVLDTVSFVRDFKVNMALLADKAGYNKHEFLEWVNRLRFSNEEKEVIGRMLFEYSAGSLIEEWQFLGILYRHGDEYYNQWRAFMLASGRASSAPALAHKQLPEFPISGSDLIKEGFEGKQIGDTIKLLETEWLKSDCSLTRNQMLETYVPSLRSHKS